MDAGVFDIVVMIIGVLLMIAGVALFVTGKLAGQNNKVEAFGIKMDVNNPSLLLVATGVGLVLVPRLLPSSAPGVEQLAQQNVVQQVQPAGTATAPSSPAGATSKNIQSANAAPSSGELAALESPPLAPQSKNTTIQSQAVPISGNTATDPFQYSLYDLLAQTEDGENTGAQGRLSVVKSAGGMYSFQAIYQEPMGIGMLSSFEYEGVLRRRGGQWFMQVTGGTDIPFEQSGEIPVRIAGSGDQVEINYHDDGSVYREVWRSSAAGAATLFGDVR